MKLKKNIVFGLMGLGITLSPILGTNIQASDLQANEENQIIPRYQYTEQVNATIRINETKIAWNVLVEAVGLQKLTGTATVYKEESGKYKAIKTEKVSKTTNSDVIIYLNNMPSQGKGKYKMNILIVEDDTAIREGVAEFLKENEYEVFCAEDGEKALEILKSKEIHLALLDIMLPKKNGIEVLKELRTFSELPVIMLTAVTDEETQVQTFDNLADDYICKPFSLILLLKRIEALLRARYKTENTWKYKDAVVDFSGYRATYLGKDAAVTPKEIKLLAVLLENAGQVVSRDQILDRIWGEEESPFDRVVDVYVKNLRKKLQLDCIITVKGVGYKLELP